MATTVALGMMTGFCMGHYGSPSGNRYTLGERLKSSFLLGGGMSRRLPGESWGKNACECRGNGLVGECTGD